MKCLCSVSCLQHHQCYLLMRQMAIAFKPTFIPSFFPLSFFLVVLCSCSRTFYISQAGLQLLILLSLSPMCWDYSHDLDYKPPLFLFQLKYFGETYKRLMKVAEPLRFILLSTESNLGHYNSELNTLTYLPPFHPSLHLMTLN